MTMAGKPSVLASLIEEVNVFSPALGEIVLDFHLQTAETLGKAKTIVAMNARSLRAIRPPESEKWCRNIRISSALRIGVFP